jgi:hypothetical protein
MGKAFVGFLVGVALTTMAFALFSEAPADNFEESELSAAPPSGTSTPLTTSESFPSYAIVAQSSTESRTIVSRSPVQETPVTLEELEKRYKEAREASDIARDEFLRAQKVAKWAAAPPPTQPINLPPEFDYLSSDPLDPHELTQREPVDAAWAATTEMRINGYLAARPEITSKYGFPQIECRTTRCELAFVATGVGDAKDFRDLTADFFAEDWTERFRIGAPPGVGIINLSVRNQGDITTLLWNFSQPDELLRRATGQIDGAF